jgi:hypothetical protein|mmetsp:Transcript_89669/g.141575  ORF Transcript_89669/g.141575 Transcript_89669/m.141575 type:complete len:435 (+) Transcript_89669:120-1424(+)|eukprot:CAMPEP_0169108200 /NCGR_PEP_ID=MMETSP1015-20121227/25297_1 /TAXON_ID=342587 /ORGANISM="Karlodinium micrum, Strain CCMP2283" /LENGTH=434 /DNA_ID=CAMNT_0009169799 /DNA_START=115 /DNA_END=1419 /DNA_ORIENTATION=+
MSQRAGARELQNFVDEEEAEEARAKAEKNKSRGFLNVDWDKACAYKTFKVVRIRDFKLGLSYWAIVSAVVLYVVVFAFSIEGKHQQQEPGVGTVLTKVIGKAYSGDKVFDPSDLRFPVIEPSGAFLLTRRVSVTQTRGKCVDWDAPKKCPCDDAAGEVCNNGYCEVATWCPSLGDKNAHDPPPEAVVDKVQGIDRIILKIMSGIAFPGIGNRFFVTGGSPGAPTSQFKNISVGELLSLSDPPLKLDSKLSEYGAFIGVSFFWNCDVSGDCEPTVVIKHLDSGQGFVQKRAHFSRRNGVETREALYMNGLRILIDSSGIGRQSSLVLAIIQIGSAIALIRVAAIVADFLMLNGGVDLCGGSLGYSKVRRDSYYKCKVTETKDYSDLQDRINLIDETKKREATGRIQNNTSAGASVALGLGAGGRGGLASAVLRGR